MSRDGRIERSDAEPLRSALDALDCQVAVLTKTGRVVLANAGWRQLAEDGTLCATQGTPGSNYFDAARSVPLRPEACQAVEGVRALIRGDRVDVSFKYPCPGAQGQAWFEMNATQCDARGEHYVVISHRAITKSKLMEERLQKRSEQLVQVLDAVPHLIALVNGCGGVDFCNASWRRRFGTGEGAMVEQEIGRRIHPADRERWLAAWREARRSGAAYGLEHRLGSIQDDEYCWFLERGAPLRGEGGVATHWVLDFTSGNDASQEEGGLQSQLRRQDESFASILHEFRSPLATMATALEVVGRNVHDVSSMTNPYAIIQRQLRQLNRLVDDLLDVLQAGRDAPELAWNRVDMADVIEAAIETSLPALNRQRHHLTVSVPRTSLWVRGDTGRLVQVVANLLINAAKYTDPGGHISVSAERTEADVLVRVRDNGRGIPREQLKRIFDLFAQGAAAPGVQAQGVSAPGIRTSEGIWSAQGPLTGQAEESGHGHGIGLAVARQLVNLHGGTIWASSEGPGAGAEFSVSLPAERPTETDVERVELRQAVEADQMASQ